MRTRPTARVLLLDETGCILLMKGRLPAKPQGPAAWFTIGGGIEPGETAEDAARREIIEESGITAFSLGPIIWTGEVEAFSRSGETVLVEDRYFLARCAGGTLSRAGWQQIERDFVDDMRWWALDEILTSTEMFYPPELKALLPEIVAGRLPPVPLRLSRRVVER